FTGRCAFPRLQRLHRPSRRIGRPKHLPRNCVGKGEDFWWVSPTCGQLVFRCSRFSIEMDDGEIVNEILQVRRCRTSPTINRLHWIAHSINSETRIGATEKTAQQHTLRVA